MTMKFEYPFPFFFMSVFSHCPILIYWREKNYFRIIRVYFFCLPSGDQIPFYFAMHLSYHHYIYKPSIFVVLLLFAFFSFSNQYLYYIVYEKMSAYFFFVHIFLYVEVSEEIRMHRYGWVCRRIRLSRGWLLMKTPFFSEG